MFLISIFLIKMLCSQVPEGSILHAEITQIIDEGLAEHEMVQNETGEGSIVITTKENPEREDVNVTVQQKDGELSDITIEEVSPKKESDIITVQEEGEVSPKSTESVDSDNTVKKKKWFSKLNCFK